MSEVFIGNYGPPQTGDALFTHGNPDNWLSPKIRWFTRSHGEDKSIASHVGVFYGSTQTCEAMPPAVRLFDWEQRKAEMHREGHAWAIVTRKTCLPNEVKFRISETIKEMIGWKYSESELILCAADGLISKIPFVGEPVIFRKLGDLWRNGVICSKTGSRAWIKNDLLPKRFEYSTPDCLWDHMMKSPDWMLADKSKNWPG